jgi:mannose-6-phosphate isomerase-like protein (cupin superfamily)
MPLGSATLPSARGRERPESGPMEVVNLREKLATFQETWIPKVVGELNGQHVKVAKLEGDYVWHAHADEDEMFLIVDGQLELQLRDRTVHLSPGEFFIVPRGVEHRPIAKQLVSIVLFEPATVRNTGEVVDDRTIEPGDLERI